MLLFIPLGKKSSEASACSGLATRVKNGTRLKYNRHEQSRSHIDSRISLAYFATSLCIGTFADRRMLYAIRTSPCHQRISFLFDEDSDILRSGQGRRKEGTI